MITLCQELKKIIDQLCGSRNIFGYKSTVANQLYLFYCFGGKICFSDKINIQVKYLWFILVLGQFIISYASILAYWWLEPDKDIIMLLNIANVFGVSTAGGFGFPLMSYLYRNEIEAMIEHVDNSLTNPTTTGSFYLKQKLTIDDAKDVFISIMGPFIVCNLIFISICFFDMALFFEEEKAQNYLFYMLPIPLIRQHSSYKSFFLTNGLSTVAFEIFIVQLWSVLAVILYWITVCRNELIFVRNYFNSGSRHLNVMIGRAGRSSAVWHRIFKGVMRNGIQQFQDVIGLVNHLRGFMETAGSFLIPVTFFYGIAVLHICSSADILFVLKLKYLAGYLATAFAAFQFYWVGENLDSSVFEVSFAVYCTPWYWSSKVRRNVYVLLCHTQSVNNLLFMKVYGLLLKNFARFLHGVFSYTNFLRKLTNE